MMKKLLIIFLIVAWSFPALATNTKTEVSITAQNTFSAPVSVYGYFSVSISGISGSTVWVQRSFNGTTWKDVKAYTADAEDVGYEPERDIWYRVGVKTGGFGSGTILGRISQ
jgi:hypothetical protein